MSGEMDRHLPVPARRAGERRPRQTPISAPWRSKKQRDRRARAIEQLRRSNSPGCDAGSVFVFVMRQNSSKRIVSATASNLVVGDVCPPESSSASWSETPIQSARPGIGISDQTKDQTKVR